ncbi:nucleotidyltransferase [Candidatus Magnetomorum sp. HK-1]|nr:nucleotidyltransferase [Candidatus Magnetomorum sp. HK-1]
MDIQTIRNTLQREDRVIFAYLYGSALTEKSYNDIDIAIYAQPQNNYLGLSTDIQILLHEHTDIVPDIFDIKIINDILIDGDIFTLLYLKSVFESNCLLIDKDFDIRSNYIENFSMKYRECEGLMDELLR